MSTTSKSEKDALENENDSTNKPDHSNWNKRFDIYRNISRVVKFTSFWITLSITVLAVIMGINSNKLKSYSSGIDKSKKYDFTAVTDICKFPCDQIDIAEGSYKELITSYKVPHTKYELILDLSGSVDTSLLNKSKSILAVDSKLMEITNDKVHPLSNRLKGMGKLGLFIGYFLNKELNANHRNISVSYYIDSKDIGKVISLEPPSKFGYWYEAIGDELESIKIQNDDNSYIDKFICDQVLGNEALQKKTIVFLTDLLVTRSLEDIENDLEKMAFDRKNNIQFVFLELPTIKKRKHTFRETFKIFDKHLTNARMIEFEDSEFQKLIGDKNNYKQIDKFAYLHARDDLPEYLLTFNQVPHKKNTSVKSLINFHFKDSSLISTENFLKSETLKDLHIYDNNEDHMDISDVIPPGEYKIDCSDYVDPDSFLSHDLGFIEIFNIENRTKTRHNIKIGENLDRNVSRFWLYLIAVALSNVAGLLSMYFASIICYNKEGKISLRVVLGAFILSLLFVLSMSAYFFTKKFLLQIIWLPFAFCVILTWLFYTDQIDKEYT